MIAVLALPGLTTLSLFAAAWLWSSVYDRRPTVRLLAALVVTSVVVVSLQVVLALAQSLAPAPLLGLAWLVAGLAIVTWFARGWPSGASLEVSPPTVPGALLGTLVLLAYLAVLLIGILVPPYGWDTLVYHLTDVFQFAQKRSLEVFGFPGRNLYYPQAGELHSLWCFLLSGAGPDSWRIVGIALLPLSLTAGVAARVTAEGLGLRAGLPWIVAGVMLAPIMMTQALAAYVDVAFAAFTLAALAFAVLAAAERRFAHVAFCATASGLALGVKISFLYFSLPVLLVLATPGVFRALAEGGPRALLRRLLLCLALTFAGCGYWLGRNLVQTGNPIYPNRVQIAGITVFDGPKEVAHSKRQQSWFVPTTASWLRYPFYETFEGRPGYSLENGFGPLFAAGFVGTGVALFLAARRRRGVLVRALLALPITVLLFLAVNPYQEPRYVIACCGFTLLALAALAEEATRGQLRLLHGVVVVGAVFSAAGGVASAAPDLPRVLAQWRAGQWSPERYFPIQYGAAGEAFNWIAENTAGGASVTFTQSAFLAPLFGWHGRNRVVYASTDSDAPIGKVMRCASYRSWRSFLRDSHVGWVVSWIPWWEGEGPTRADGWIAEHPDDFALVKDFGGRARIYVPVFREGEWVRRAESTLPDVKRLDAPGAWVMEYEQGSTARILAHEDGGVRIDYRFETGENDYIDLRADLGEADWSTVAAFSFEIEEIEPAPALVFVYLKDEDPRQACRFLLDLRTLPPGGRHVALDLTSPEWKTGRFDLTNVRQVHLVVDDAEDGRAARGSLRVSGFRLEPRAGSPASLSVEASR